MTFTVLKCRGRRVLEAALVRTLERIRAAATGDLHGFPAALTSFIGRAGTVREVAGLLEQYRLVTVTGPGGAG